MQIAKMNAMLTATAKGFVSAFGEAGKTLKSFSLQAGATAAGLAAYDFGKNLALSAYNTIGLVKAQSEAIDVAAKFSDSIGINVKELSRLQYAASYAGVGNENLQASLRKMVQVMGTAATKGGESALAFEMLGLNAADLANMPTDIAIGKIADGLNRMTNQSQRAYVASQIFGKNWTGIIPLLQEGSEGLRRAGIEADKLGFSFDRVDAAQVEAANDAIQKVRNVLTGVATQLAIKLAPFITAMADKLSELAMQGSGAAGFIIDGFEMVVSGIAKATDYLNLFKAGWHLLRAGVIAPIGGIIKAVDLVGKSVVELLNLLPGVEMQWTATFSAMADSMIQDAADAATQAKAAFDSFNKGENATAAAAFFDDLRSKARTAAEEAAKAKTNYGGLVEEIAEGIDYSGIPDADKEISEVFDAMERNASRVQEILSDLTFDQSIAGMTALEQEIARNRRELESLGATQEQIAQAEAAIRSADAGKLVDMKASVADAIEAPGLHESGSQGAASFLNKLSRQQFDNKDQQKTAKQTERTAKATEQVRDEMRGFRSDLAVTEIV